MPRRAAIRLGSQNAPAELVDVQDEHADSSAEHNQQNSAYLFEKKKGFCRNPSLAAIKTSIGTEAPQRRQQPPQQTAMAARHRPEPGHARWVRRDRTAAPQ
ncbi:dihydrodipicolinate synthase [Corchorus capsularis]|uniref:Dihydrodipicolinate synthase n=1 Tax=Corchorus capsularis TaxID=210143 RepID=A0A1R3G1L1_COCAP|nr:dihydrodipicolinate synthase [Corchorus capsularis]